MDATLLVAIVALIASIATALITTSSANARERESRTAALKNVLQERQVQAVERLWAALKAASRSAGIGTVIGATSDQGVEVNVNEANRLLNDLLSVFLSPDGLYFSRSLRAKLFDLRDYIVDEMMPDSGENNVIISKNKSARFSQKVQELRIAIRAELNLADVAAVDR